MPICTVDEMRAYLAVEQEKMLDCLARFFIDSPQERAREIWRQWEDEKHRFAKPKPFMQDLRKRITREREMRAAKQESLF